MRRLLVLLALMLALGCATGVAIWAALGVPGRGVVGQAAPASVLPGGPPGVGAAEGSGSVGSLTPAASLPPSAAPSAAPSSSPAPASPAGTAVPSPTPTPYTGPLTRIVPVLMYHRISDPAPGAPYPGLYVSPAAFNAQMRALHDAGWRTITAGELGADMAANRPVPVRTIVLMFDDGYADNYLNAFPILQKYGFRATFSVVARGGTNMMTSQELATMAQAGMEIGNHTLDHRNVSRLSGAMLATQIEGGALRIQSRLASQGVAWNPVTFVYPSGHVGPAALALLAQLRYTDAFTEVPGFAVIGRTPPLQIPRQRVSRFESLAQFLARLPSEPRP